MTISPSRLAYPDCFEAFDRALADDKGVRLRANDYNHALHLRTRMHTARSIDRKDNIAIHADDTDHPLYGRSIYDTLVIRVREVNGEAFVYVEKIRLMGEVESLSQVGGTDSLPMPQPQAQIEAKPEPKQIEHLSMPRRL